MSAAAPRIPFDQLLHTVQRVLHGLGIEGARAELAARLIAETDLDGVSTHGIARVPRFAEMVRLGRIHASATPVTTTSLGALERWDGRLGPGNLAAHAAMQRAMELAREHGLGGVALANTTHWQRGGSYGWQAATGGCAAICWSNTLPNLPPWGATTPALGNNPLVIAIPRQAGSPSSAGPIVLDMAMSQFSYGSISKHIERSEQLLVPGGFTTAGELTTDPAAIEASQRALPIGFWKGSGLALVLDVLGALLASGRATHQIGPDALHEVGQSQIFLAFGPQTLAGNPGVAAGAIAALRAAVPQLAGHPARFPGEAVALAREQNRTLGVPVSPNAWAALLNLLPSSAA